MIHEIRIGELIEKFLTNNLTETEKAELETWAAISAENRTFLNQFQDTQYVKDELRAINEAVIQRSRQKVFKAINVKPQFIPRKSWKQYLVAAVAIVAVAAASLFLMRPKQRRKVEDQLASFSGTDLPAGTNRAVLTLPGGTTMWLDSAKNGTLARLGAVKVVKSGDRLLYSGKQPSGANAGDLGYNIVSTPRGGQYAIVLQDGTRVWLNAASSLKFPAVFTGMERRVELTGEGYFEVKENKTMPFRVVITSARDKVREIEVLGTHFNVMAYANEPQVNTTLLEGHIRLKSAGNSNNAELYPGQQAIIARDDRIEVKKNYDVEQSVAWKNGLQVFDNTDLKTLMRQIERWYNVDVVYAGPVPADLQITGKIPRSISLQKLLTALDINSELHFKVEQGKVTVMQ